MKWAIVALVVLVLALAGSTAYLGYDRIASDEDGEPGQQPASEVAGVTPTAGPSIDLELSRRCYEAWRDIEMYFVTDRDAPTPSPEDYRDYPAWVERVLDPWRESVLGSGWKERRDSAYEMWETTCLSPSVVPVPHPVSDIDVLCVAARAEALRMSGTPPDEMSGVDYKKLTVLETFVRSRCP